MAAIQFTEATKAYPRTIAPAGKYPIVGDRIYRTLQDAQDYVDGKSSSKSAIPGIYLSVIDDGINNGAYWVEQAAGYDGATSGVLRKMGAGGGGGGGDVYLSWDDITGKPSFADVATSGSYNDLKDKPSIPDLSVLGSLAYKDSLSWSEIVGRPTKLSDFTNDAGFITSAALVGYLKAEDAETIYITEEEAENRYVKRGGDSINGDISFGGSIKIGGATLSWDEDSHALKVDTSFYTEKQLASGGIGNASGSGLGLLLTEWPTDSEDYSKYALGGNLGIELNTRLTAVEGKATNVTVSPTLSQGKPMGTIMVDGVSQTMYAPASYSADDIVPTQERNFVSLQDIEYWNTAYLPKTGGTLSGTEEAILEIKRTNNTSAFIKFTTVRGNNGYLGFDSGGKPTYLTYDGTANELYHKGNLDLSTYATQAWAEVRYLKLGGGIINGTSTDPVIINTTATSVGIRLRIDEANRAFVGYGKGVGAYLYTYDTGAYIGVDNSGSPFYHNGTKNTLIHSGNIGSYKAGSATKLEGSYHGSSDASNNPYFFVKQDGKSKYYIQAYAGVLYIGPAVNGIVVNSSSNVTIGSSDLAGTDYKLAVNGAIRAQALRSSAKDFIIYGYDGTNFVNAIDVDCNNSNLWIGYGSAAKSYNTEIAGNNIYFRYGTSRTAGFSLLSSGNFGVHVPASFGSSVYVASQLLFGSNSDTGGYFASGSDGTYWGAYTHSKTAYKASNAYFYPNGSVRFPNNVDIGVAFNGTPSSGKLKIGNAILSWDSANNALKIEGNVYATGQMASGGIGTAVATIASDHEDRIAQLEAKVESLMS